MGDVAAPSARDPDLRQRRRRSFQERDPGGGVGLLAGDGREEARGAATYDHDLAAGVTHRAMLPAYYPGRASVLPVPRFAVVGQGGSTPVAPVLRPGPGRLDDRRDAVQVRQAQRPQVALDGLEVGVDAQRV